MHLPIYYPEDVKTTVVNGKEKTDTIYHTIPPFRFVNQDGDTVTEKNFENKIYVADFFFTTCPTICPKMSLQMQRVEQATNDMQDFAIISHSVNPEYDTVAVLAEYAKRIGADSKRWHLVTGNKKNIYDIAIDGYKLAVDEDPRAPGGFLHSELFVLVDKQKRIRGYYDGTDSSQVDKLLNDIKILSAEYESRNSKYKIEQKH
jgi:protein SCO1/2